MADCETSMRLFTNLLQGGATTEKLDRTPKYTVVNQTQNYEERVYPASTWVCTSVCGVYQDTAKIEGFSRLQSYVMGQNKSGATLTMEPPILTRVLSNDGSSFDRKFIVSTYLCKDHVHKHPEPTNTAVFIEHIPKMTVYVRTFAGLSSEERWTYETKKLAELLFNKTDLRTDYFITAIYGNPFQLMSERNEVWLVQYDPKTDVALMENSDSVVQVGSQKLELPRPVTWILYCVLLYIYVVINICRSGLKALSLISNNRTEIVEHATTVGKMYISSDSIFSIKSLTRTAIGFCKSALTLSVSAITGFVKMGEAEMNKSKFH